MAFEFLLLKCFFNQHGISIRFVSLDNRPTVVEAANQLHKIFLEEFKAFCCDASKPAEVKKILDQSVFISGEGAHLILFRNAPMMIDAFQKMIKQTVPVIAAPLSEVLVTTRTSSEQTLAVKAMTSASEVFHEISSKKLSELKEHKNDTFYVLSFCKGLFKKPASTTPPSPKAV